MKILFRTDASLKIGTGHVMRCLTLAESLREEGAEVTFVCRAHPGNLIGMLRERALSVQELTRDKTCFQNQSPKKSRLLVQDYQDWLGCTQEEDAQATLKVVGKEHFDWLIVDHYALDEHWERRLRPVTQKLMVIDDLANRRHDCDLLLDQNYFDDTASRYDRLIPSSSLRFLGPEYALLRPEFSAARKKLQPRKGEVKRVFVFFGGTDPDNITGRALEALSDPALQHLEVDVVLGSTNPHRERVSNQVARRPNTQLHVQVANIAELMAKADLALGAGGTTTWERLSLELPSLVVTIAENQSAFTEALNERGSVVYLGEQSKVTSRVICDALLEEIKKRSANPLPWTDGPNVDGQGLRRVTEFCINSIAPENWVLREATQKDCLLYWQWANEPEVRKQAFAQEMISWETHVAWFQERLKDTQTMLVLVISKVGPIGQVRFEMTNRQATISYSLGRSIRGYGLGKILLEKAIAYFKQKHSFDLYAEVKVSNRRSVQIFESLGFKKIKGGSNRQKVSYFQHCPREATEVCLSNLVNS